MQFNYSVNHHELSDQVVHKLSGQMIHKLSGQAVHKLSGQAILLYVKEGFEDSSLI